MRRPIENNSLPGEAVYEPFCGSGTTIIAAEMSGRRCLAIELDPAYVDLAIQRWQAFTGEEARCDADARSFEEVRAERAGRAEPASRAEMAEGASAVSTSTGGTAPGDADGALGNSAALALGAPANEAPSSAIPFPSPSAEVQP